MTHCNLQYEIIISIYLRLSVWYTPEQQRPMNVSLCLDDKYINDESRTNYLLGGERIRSRFTLLSLFKIRTKHRKLSKIYTERRNVYHFDFIILILKFSHLLSDDKINVLLFLGQIITQLINQPVLPRNISLSIFTVYIKCIFPVQPKMAAKVTAIANNSRISK